MSFDIQNAPKNNFIDETYQHLSIERIAFYRARYGEIEYIDISYFDENIIEEAKKKLAHYFFKHPNKSRPMIENLHVLEALANA